MMTRHGAWCSKRCEKSWDMWQQDLDEEHDRKQRLAEWHTTIRVLECAGTFLYPTFITDFAKIVGHKPMLPLSLGALRGGGVSRGLEGSP